MTHHLSIHELRRQAKDERASAEAHLRSLKQHTRMAGDALRSADACQIRATDYESAAIELENTASALNADEAESRAQDEGNRPGCRR